MDWTHSQIPFLTLLMAGDHSQNGGKLVDIWNETTRLPVGTRQASEGRSDERISLPGS